MSMFDYVNGEFKCPKCGKIIKDFQTKEHDCTLSTIDFRLVDYFYSKCWNCNAWINATLNDECIRKIEEFRRSFTAEDYFVAAEEKE